MPRRNRNAGRDPKRPLKPIRLPDLPRPDHEVPQNELPVLDTTVTTDAESPHLGRHYEPGCWREHLSTPGLPRSPG
jgi:hypothetical protein